MRLYRCSWEQKPTRSWSRREELGMTKWWLCGWLSRTQRDASRRSINESEVDCQDGRPIFGLRDEVVERVCEWMTSITQQDASEDPESEPRLWMLAKAVRFWKIIYSKFYARKWSMLERPNDGLSVSELIGCLYERPEIGRLQPKIGCSKRTTGWSETELQPAQ